MSQATSASGTTARDRFTTVEINPIDGLEHFLKAIEGQSQRGRIKCDGRSVLLVSPGLPHESAAERFDTLLKEIFDVMSINALACESVFYRLPPPGQNKGFEPDKSYFLGHAANVLGLKDIDLSVSPPPDLVIEVVDSHAALKAVNICRRLLVPEVWVYKVRKAQLVFQGLTETPGAPACYTKLPQSHVLPFLTPADVAPWAVATPEFTRDFKRRARAWVETVLVPRQQAGG